MPRTRAEATWELRCISLRLHVDKLKQEIRRLEAATHASEQEAVRAVRQRDAAAGDAASRIAALEAAAEEAEKAHGRELRSRLCDANKDFRARKRELEAERIEAEQKLTSAEAMVTDLNRQLSRAQAALRTGAKESAASLEAIEEELTRVRAAQEGSRAWGVAREEEARRKRAEEECSRLQAEVESLSCQAEERSRARAHEKQELTYLRHRVKCLQVRS